MPRVECTALMAPWVTQAPMVRRISQVLPRAGEEADESRVLIRVLQVDMSHHLDLVRPQR